MTPFPIIPIPDPHDDGFDELVCQKCGGSGVIALWSQWDPGIIGYTARWFKCDCQPEEG